MTQEPDFRELVGDEGDREELERLRRVHELLVAAGPPPELSPAVADPPEVEESKVLEFKRRRPATLLAAGIAAAAAAFVIGYAVGDHHNGFSEQFSVPMRGIGQAVAARADIVKESPVVAAFLNGQADGNKLNAVFRPDSEKFGSGRPSNGRGKAKRSGLPASAARSTSGPPG